MNKEYSQALEEMGFVPPKDPEDYAVSEDVQAKAEELFEAYSAFRQAGFQYSEAIELTKPIVTELFGKEALNDTKRQGNLGFL